MKRFIIFICALFFSMGAATQECSATMFAEGNLQYPIWKTTEKDGYLYDLSSCFILWEDNEKVIVKTLNYYMTYKEGGDGLTFQTGDISEAGNVYFIIMKKGGKLYYRVPEKPDAEVADYYMVDPIILAFNKARKLKKQLMDEEARKVMNEWVQGN